MIVNDGLLQQISFVIYCNFERILTGTEQRTLESNEEFEMSGL